VLRELPFIKPPFGTDDKGAILGAFLFHLSAIRPSGPGLSASPAFWIGLLLLYYICKTKA
jgi:hypothetical protein